MIPILPSMVFTPYQINQDSYFGPDLNGSDIQKPLCIAIEEIKHALQRITQQHEQNHEHNADTVVDIDSIIRQNNNNNSSVLRIQHVISHSVDPLCWLHQQDKRQQIQQHQQQPQPQRHPMLYFGNDEQSLEAAIVGAAYQHSGAANETLWNIISSLPESSHIYGGERFDPNTHPKEEWKDFGAGVWILPAVELRRTSVSTTILSVHLYNTSTWAHAAQHCLTILNTLTATTSPAIPPTTLPPVISRDAAAPHIDGQDIFEQGVMSALTAFNTTPLEKVVMARRSQLLFDAPLSALDLLRKWKFGGMEGGHLFYLDPGGQSNLKREFLGCTPERLFRISDSTVVTEALAGTRPRGTTQEEDTQLSRDLYTDPKDRAENEITGRFIREQLLKANAMGLIKKDPSVVDDSSRYFIRRLRHLQHICQRFQCQLEDGVNVAQISKVLLQGLHPTPAVCGYPAKEAIQFIRNMENKAFDRGFYSGPFGFLSKNTAEIVVAIRSGLVSTPMGRSGSSVSVYAGAGVVPGSTVQGEWSETSYKLNVVSSLFPQSPITLSSAPTPNVAWATALVEELIRCGVTQFYVCPGSRSTPLVAAIAKAVRTNVGVVNAVSVHDERGAGFRAVGYARATGRPAAVITSSGTAIANLYPAIMEGGMDAVPMLILTADRPYESRDTGANQAIDQVKAFSSTYIRWFRDIPPPSDDVPVSLVLSDTNHAVALSVEMKGPVHLNIQFRENLAPDAGPIRNDNRVDSVTSFNSYRFTDTPAFQRWSTSGDRWLHSFYQSQAGPMEDAVMTIASMIAQSKRGIIVVGNVRSSDEQNVVADMISQFAEQIGFPIFAGIQSGNLRSRSSSVVPYAEHLLKHPSVASAAKPDFVLQIGHPLISSEVPKMIKAAVTQKDGTMGAGLVLLHPHHPSERSDPELFVSHRISSEVVPFLREVINQLKKQGLENSCCSALSPIILLGRQLQAKMPHIINQASQSVVSNSIDPLGDLTTLTEPQIVIAMADVISELDLPMSLFLSNSMPVRDAEFFLYPKECGLSMVGVNRGASGIDGIISSTSGFSEGMEMPTSLLIGDLASLHDINSFHALSDTKASVASQKKAPITTVVVNNDGGGIFSFLPIAKHGKDVNFDEFFGTPTNSFSFRKGAEAFGLLYREAHTSRSFSQSYMNALQSNVHNILEAKVVSRQLNVAVHKEVSNLAKKYMDGLLEVKEIYSTKLPAKFYTLAEATTFPSVKSGIKTLLLLHGWMGDKSEWDEVGSLLVQSLPPDWSILALDLPGHGDTSSLISSDSRIIRSALGLSAPSQEASIESLAVSVMKTLIDDYGITKLDAVAGYSLGGRVALAMKGLCSVCGDDEDSALLGNDTKLILLGANPGQLPALNRFVSSEILQSQAVDEERRKVADEALSEHMYRLFVRSRSIAPSSSRRRAIWSEFVENWYSAPLWGDLKHRNAHQYQDLVRRRVTSLDRRGDDISAVLREGSPSQQNILERHVINAEYTLFVAGELDTKYVKIGKQLSEIFPELSVTIVANSGHGLLIENSSAVCDTISKFLSETKPGKNSSVPLNMKSKAILSNATSTAIPQHDKVASQKGIEMPFAVATSQGKSEARKLATLPLEAKVIGGLDFEAFSIAMVGDDMESSVSGIGWGETAASNSRMKHRSGFIIQIVSDDRSMVGIGEVSPLAGLHSESLADVKMELVTLQKHLSDRSKTISAIAADDILSMQGGLHVFIQSLLKSLGIKTISPSVKSGLEMALLSFAAQIKRLPLLTAISGSGNALPLNGLVMRGSGQRLTNEPSIRYSSLKVKVGHQSAQADSAALTRALHDTLNGGKIRADANRAWDEPSAIQFAAALEVLDVNIIRRIEFVEEPLQKVTNDKWKIASQIKALERWYEHTGIKYALDESISDLVTEQSGNFEVIAFELKAIFDEGVFGCAALVLKPALLGFELSMKLARLATSSLGICPVFSSSFDSGVGLAYTAFLAAANESKFAHGIGTFSMLAGDTLSPSFGSYVSDKGFLHVSSLSRALFGLGLDEMRGSFSAVIPEGDLSSDENTVDYQASTATSSSGRELSVLVTLPLPFSDDIASARFTDLPQQSRWSPWLSSVAYLDAGRETEWTLNVRGVRFSWRAVSNILETPYRGIQWESISGLGNLGVVEFVPTATNTCLMKVRMTILIPRILTTLFPGASVFLEDFLENKLLKWSLEMFRDVVKGDLALERGDVELGDALFGAVEGRANAIEATLSLPPMSEPGPKSRDYK
jgi:2-succinyl-5-enolpyruvyl-6-hydroxy-3-cyclohexene-1-carboxylate synthase/o-succinylbenzoate synthase